MRECCKIHFDFLLVALVLLAMSCSKEMEQSKSKERALDSSDEIAALREEVEALKEETESLKLQLSEIVLNTKSEEGRFEVDGLLFDRNGDVVSLVKKSQSVDDGRSTITRKYDDKGRLIEVFTDYHSKGDFSGNPYNWQKLLYTYNGKEITTATQTNRQGMAAGLLYEEVVSTAVYW